MGGACVEHGRPRPRIAQGFGAGAGAGAFVSLLTLAIHFFKLRRVFIALKKDLLDILTFDQHIGVAVAILILGGALIGLLGAAVCSMPPKLRRPLVIGLTWAFFTGLFQELIQLMLQYEFLMKVREVFFTWDGLRLQGAFIVFGLAAVASAVWQAYRPRYDALSPSPPPRWPRTSRAGWRTRGSVAPGPRSATMRTWRRRSASTSSDGSEDQSRTCGEARCRLALPRSADPPGAWRCGHAIGR